MPRSGRRNTAAVQVPSAGPQTIGLKRKLNAGKLGFTVDGLLPNYQRKDRHRGSVPAKSTANGPDTKKTEGVFFRRSHSLQEFTSVTPLVVSLDEFPDPPEAEEDLNARMELLFEEYRQVELGLIFKTTDKDKSNASEVTPVEKADEKRRSRRPNERRGIAGGTSAQTPRNCRTPRKESPFSDTGVSKPNQVQTSPSAVSSGFRANRTASTDRASKAIRVNNNWRCSNSVERLKDSARNCTAKTHGGTVNQEMSVSIIKERSGGKPLDELHALKQHQIEAKHSKERLPRPNVTIKSSKSNVPKSNVAKGPSFEVNMERGTEKTVNRQISHHSNTESSGGDKKNKTDSLSSGSDSPGSFAPASGIKPCPRKGKGHGLSSRIPVPIQLKSYSTSRLNRCDSGVDITNNLKFG